MTNAPRIRILFLAASPGSMDQGNAAQEAREIREKLRMAAHRDSIELVERFAVRPGDLQQTFFEVRPHIVHFSGHGTTDEELVLEDDHGGAWPLGKSSLADLFRVHKDQIRVVVLNACHSRPQVEAISEHIECAIGMRRAIGSQAAMEFSAAFYLAIGYGSSVQKAFESAVAELSAKGIPENRTPQLVLRPGTDAARVLLISSSSTPKVAPALGEPGRARHKAKAPLMVSSTTLDPETVFAGKYRVVKLIGRGGVGAVYEAEQLATGAKKSPDPEMPLRSRRTSVQQHWHVASKVDGVPESRSGPGRTCIQHGRK